MEFAASAGEKENIWVASSDGNIAQVKSLLDSGVSVHAQDESGYTPIHAAVSYAHLELIKFLLDAGADVNCRDMDGDCPLHIVEEPSVAEFLLAHGANEQLVNNEGLSVYQQALELENEEMVKFWANRLGIDLTMRPTEEQEGGEAMDAIAEEDEEGTVEMSEGTPDPVVYPPGTIITPGEALPEPLNKP